MAPPMQGFSEGDEELHLGYVYGYRVWTAGPPGPMGPMTLWGAYGHTWLIGTMSATCRRAAYMRQFTLLSHSAVVPDPACGCGFWAYWGYDKAALVFHVTPAPKIRTAVTGLIRASGHVIIGEKGFRCENAEILLLCTAKFRYGLARSLSEQYQVPVTTSQRKFKRMARSLTKGP